MASNSADYASLVAKKVAHTAISDSCSSDEEGDTAISDSCSSDEEVQDNEALCQDLKDMYNPDFQRDYSRLIGECKLVTVRFSPEESCDEFASVLAAELQKMSYNVSIIGLDCSGAEKDQILLHSSLRLFLLSDSFFRNEDCLIDAVKSVQVPMLSLFYKLSMSKFEDEKQRKLWREEWCLWKDRNENMAKWEQALEVLGSCDGIEYSTNVMHYLQAVAEAVARCVPLQVCWSQASSQVQGKIQLCEKVDALFQSNASLINGGTQVLGVHGIWGVGKSTLGKTLCDFYSSEFGGRVSYVELGSTPLPVSHGIRLDRLNRILQELFEADADFLKWHVRDLGQTNTYMDYCLGQASKKVFLVVDNIQDSLQSFEEARDLFIRKVPFPRGSKVLLLARSPHTLRGFLQPLDSLSDSVVEFPSHILCTVCDQIFGQALESALSESAMETLRKGHDKDDLFRYFFPEFFRSCHPLTIKSLAAFAQSRGPFGDLAYETESHQKEELPTYPIAWKDTVRIHHCMKEGLLDYVFETLQKSYKSFDSMEKQFFLDVALFMPNTNIHRLRQLHDFSEELFSTTSKCLRKLRNEAFLLFMGREIQMPAACRCFAEQIVQRDSSAQMLHIARESVQWACMFKNVLKASNKLQRIALESCHFVDSNDTYDCLTLDLSRCEHLSVLRLWGNKSEKRIEVRLHRNNMLKSLEVVLNECWITITGHCHHIKCFQGDYAIKGLSTLDFEYFETSENLQVLEIFTHPHKSASLRDFQRCRNLNVLRLHYRESPNFYTSENISRGGGPPLSHLHLQAWISLRELVLEGVVELCEFTGLHQLHNLSVLHLSGLKRLRNLEGMGKLSKLEEFHLLDCDSIYTVELPGSSRLRHCCIYRCKFLSIIQVTEVAGQSSDDDEDDEAVKEESRCWLQYDADMWRGSTNGSLLFNPDSHVCCDRQQDQCRRYFRFDTPTRSDITGPMFNSGDQYVCKFEVYGCPLQDVDRLLGLTAIQVFEISLPHGGFSALVFWHIISCYYARAFECRITRFVFERGVPPGILQLSLLELAGPGNVELEVLMQGLHLAVRSQKLVVRLQKLVIECGHFSWCGCGSRSPSFSLLPHVWLRELKYGCPRVYDLSSMDCLVELTSLDLKGCKKVKRWPDFSKMSNLSALDLRNTSWKDPHPFFNKVVTSPACVQV